MSITSEIQALGSPCCLDMETALAPLCFGGRGQVRLLQFYSELGEHWYDLQTFADSDWDELKVVLENPNTTWIGQNLAFDYRCLLGCGIRLQGRLEDTLIQSALLTNGLANTSNSLEAIALRVLKLSLDKKLQAQDWMAADLNEADLDYAMNDVRITYRCWEEMRAQIKTARLQRVYDLECSLIPAVVEMEHTGMLVDQQQALAAIAQLEEEITASRGEFLDLLDQRLRSAADAA
jgi:ribonuclease D